MNDTPDDNPSSTPKKRADRRATITLKGDQFGPEFRNLINKAAKRAGSTQSEWVADILTAAAQRVLKGLPPEAEQEHQATPPAVMAERLNEQDKRLSELADQVRLLTEMQRRTLWQRLRGLVSPQ